MERLERLERQLESMQSECVGCGPSGRWVLVALPDDPVEAPPACTCGSTKYGVIVTGVARLPGETSPGDALEM